MFSDAASALKQREIENPVGSRFQTTATKIKIDPYNFVLYRFKVGAFF